jgi:hypothetical protein
MTWIGHDLIREALTELADADYQRRVWTATSGPEVGSFSEAISRLYDDSGLGDALDADREVYGPELDGMLRSLATAIDGIDGRRPPAELIEDPHLVSVRRQAASILRRIGPWKDSDGDP